MTEPSAPLKSVFVTTVAASTVAVIYGLMGVQPSPLTALFLAFAPLISVIFLGAERRTFPSARHHSGSGFLCLPAVARAGPMVRYQDSWHASLEVSTLAACRGGRPADSGISCCTV